MTTDTTLAALEKHHAEAAAAYAEAAAEADATARAATEARRAQAEANQRAWAACTAVNAADYAVDAYKDPIGTAAAAKFWRL